MFEEYEDVYEPTAADEIYLDAVKKFKDLLSDDVNAIAQKARNAQNDLDQINSQIRQAKFNLRYVAEEYQREKEKAEQYKMHDLPRALVERMVAETTGGYVPGDKVWHIKENWSYSKCPRCSGKKKLLAKIGNGEDELVSCPQCGGSGVVNEVSRSVEQDEVNRVDMKLVFEECRCGVWTNDAVFIVGRNSSINPKNLYRTKEEAEAELAEIEKETEVST